MAATASAWARDALDPVGSGDLGVLEGGAKVMLIATPKESFVTCAAHAAASEVVDAPEYAAFDYVPVSSQGDIVGLFRRSGREAHVPPADGTVERLMEPLSEHNLISADAGIIDFLSEADRQPYRLVVKGTGIAGIVTLADLQKLPVRPVLFLLVTHVELLMADLIRKSFHHSGEWEGYLSGPRRQKLDEEYSNLAKNNYEPSDKLVCTNYCDKRTILIKSRFLNSVSSAKAEHDLKRIEGLRNSVAHAGNYAATPGQAAELAETVRLVQEWIGTLQGSLRGGAKR